MAGETGKAGGSKGYKIKNVRWVNDSGKENSTSEDSQAGEELPCKCNSRHKTKDKATANDTSGSDAKKDASSDVEDNEPLEKAAFEKKHNLQPLMPGWYLHRSASPMVSLGRSPFTTWAPVQPQGVTVVGQSPAAPVYVQQQPPVYFGGVPNPYIGQFNHPQIVRVPGHPGGGPPMLSRPGMHPNGPAPGVSSVYTTGRVGPTFYGPPGGPPVAPGHPGFGLPPDITGIGRTGGEISSEQAHIAEQQDLTKPQDFKPADDDPSRFYWMRELDGEWTQRNRLTIDHLGCRWFLHEAGYFYAVRLPN